MCRSTRLTSSCSKKLENHLRMLSLYFVHYDPRPVHKSPKVSPAMAAGVTGTLRDMEWNASLIDARAPKPGPRGSYEGKI